MKTPLCGMLTLAAIYFTAQTTTPPTGKVGINTNAPTESLDIKGNVRIQGLYSENDLTGTKLSETDDNKTFTATDVVTANANGVLGKKSLSSIIAAQTPNFPWKKVGTTDNAVPANGLSMYSKYKAGIGDYSNAGSEIKGALEVLDGPEDQFALRRDNYIWNFNAYTVNNNPFLTIVGRPNNKRLLSLSSLGALYLGSGMTDSAGSGANLILDGGTGTIGIGKNSTDYDLDVNGYTRISQLPTSNDYAKYYTTENGTRVQKTKTDKYVPAKMVVVDANGVLGKQDFPTIPTIPTIPTEPWQVAGSTTQANANNQNIYQSGKVGIGNYSGTDIGSNFEINGGGSAQLGLINGSTKWDISTEDKALTFTKRKPNNGRIFSLTDEAAIYLGNTLGSVSGNGAKLILDGGNGKIGINKNSADYNLDVAGDAKISGLKTTNDDITSGSTTSKYLPAKMVVADANGVLGKVDIPVIPTIPTEPWNKLGGTTQATANTDNIYQKGKVGIGDYTSTSTFESDFEVSSNRNGYQIGIANGDSKWNLSTESGEERAFSITKRHPNNQGRLLSLDKDAKLYLGNALLNTSGSGAKILVDGGQGKVAIGKNSADYNLDVAGNAGIKGQLNLIDSSNDNNKFLTYTEGAQLLFDKKITVPALNNTTQTGVMASLTNVGKLYLGNNLTKPNGETLYTKNANILLDGQDGKVAIGKNSADYNLDVKGNAKISGLPEKSASDTVKMVVVDNSGVLKKADIPTGGGSGNGVTNHTGSNDAVQCNAANAGTIHYKEGVTVNGQPTSVMGFCMKTASTSNKYRWFYIFGGAGTTTGSEADAPNFGDGL